MSYFLYTYACIEHNMKNISIHKGDAPGALISGAVLWVTD